MSPEKNAKRKKFEEREQEMRGERCKEKISSKMKICRESERKMCQSNEVSRGRDDVNGHWAGERGRVVQSCSDSTTTMYAAERNH